MTQGEGRGLANASRDIFFKILNYITCIVACFFEGKRLLFGKFNCHVTPGGGWGGGPYQCHKMTHGGGGLNLLGFKSR